MSLLKIHTSRTVFATGLVLIFSLIAGFSTNALASIKTTQAPLRSIHVNLNDKAALRNGALYTLHMCTACHSIQGTRFSSLPPILGMTKDNFLKFINTSGKRYHDTITTNMPPTIMKHFVNIIPPDLTDIARRRSPSWLYTYLTSFYVDPSRPTGVNNTVFYNVAMPDVFASMQGLQSPVIIDGLRFGSPAKVAVGVKPLTKGTMSAAQFDTTAKDIVSFLYAVAHPHQQERAALGPWILALFGLLTIISFLIYKTFWRRVITSEDRWWRHSGK